MTSIKTVAKVLTGTLLVSLAIGLGIGYKEAIKDEFVVRKVIQVDKEREKLAEKRARLEEDVRRELDGEKKKLEGTYQSKINGVTNEVILKVKEAEARFNKRVTQIQEALQLRFSAYSNSLASASNDFRLKKESLEKLRVELSDKYTGTLPALTEGITNNSTLTPLEKRFFITTSLSKREIASRLFNSSTVCYQGNVDGKSNVQINHAIEDIHEIGKEGRRAVVLKKSNSFILLSILDTNSSNSLINAHIYFAKDKAEISEALKNATPLLSFYFRDGKEVVKVNMEHNSLDRTVNGDLSYTTTDKDIIAPYWTNAANVLGELRTLYARGVPTLNPTNYISQKTNKVVSGKTKVSSLKIGETVILDNGK